MSSSSGAPADVVGPYLASVLDDERWRDVTVSLISGGKSNLTYLLESPAGELVLRRPPLGAVLPTAHDMGREFTVLNALKDTPVPTPRTRWFCEDTSVLGARFYLMERAVGHVLRDALPPGYAETPEERRALTGALVDGLVALHAVDAESVGLAGFGKPDGFLARQIRRWRGQLEASTDQPSPELVRLTDDLAVAVPDSPAPTIVHGDYRVDNTVMHPTDPGTLVAILDWEMSTRGDPLSDLGILAVYWRLSAEQAGDGPGLVGGVTGLPGFPSADEVAALYAERSGRDVSSLPWYVAWGYAKLAMITEGIVARVRAGAYGDADLGDVADRIPVLIEFGRAEFARL